jgi:hypothetical protein
MKLKLPHKNYNLNMELSIKERLPIIDEILNECIEFHEQKMTVEEYFRYTWDKQNTKVCLDIIGYYLTKENRNLEILSNKKQIEMLKGSERHTTFSGMGYDNQLAVGLVEIDEEGY